MFRISNVFLLFILLIPSAIWAQVGLSNYGVKGIGLVQSGATARNRAMGGLGIGNSHYLYLNSMNPATLTRNNFYTTIEAAFSVENTRFASTTQQDRSGSGGLDYLGIAFPVKYDFITMSLGLQPYSVVNYALSYDSPIVGTNDVAQIRLNGDGGLSQAHIAAGIQVTDELSLGGRAAYLFGDITRETSTLILNDSINNLTSVPQLSSTRYSERTSFSDLAFQLGVSYRKQLSEADNTWLMAGAIYDVGGNLDASRFFKRERYAVSVEADGSFSQESLIYSDTVVSDLPGMYSLPQGYGIGVSYEKLYNYAFGADLYMRNWSEFESFEGGNENLQQSMRVAVGGEWTPDYASASAGTYYKRMTYRLGLHYEKTPFEINEQTINDFGINFGLSLPVANASSLHTTFTFGQRGKTENDLVRERYFRLTLGVTFNDRWFNRVKYD